MANQKTILSLLDKLGAKYTDKITSTRALAKVRRAVETADEIPVGLTNGEKAVLAELGLLDTSENEKSDKAEKSTAKKSDKAEKSTAKKSDKAEKKEKAARPDWMTVCTRAVLEAKSLEIAVKRACDAYLKQGGNVTTNSEKNAVLNVSRAIKVLVEAGVVEVGESGTIEKR